MKTAKATPGPWKASRGPERSCGGGETVIDVEVSTNGGATFVAGVFPDSFAQTQANARLIAAAPELLSVLKEVVHGNAGPGSLSWSQAHARAVATIAKAEGK